MKDPLEANEYEVDTTDDEDLEAAMREALEAVESIHPEEGDATAEVAGESSPPRSDDADAEELSLLRQEVAELRDRSVRTLADFDNFRKRADREREEQRQYAGSEVLREILPVIDNLERALESAPESDDLTAGVTLILRQLTELLKRHGVERVEALGCPFDPAIHDAVSRQDEEDLDVATVREELQAGYIMKDRLLRPAMVVVAVPTVSPQTDEDSD